MVPKDNEQNEGTLSQDIFHKYRRTLSFYSCSTLISKSCSNILRLVVLKSHIEDIFLYRSLRLLFSFTPHFLLIFFKLQVINKKFLICGSICKEHKTYRSKKSTSIHSFRHKSHGWERKTEHHISDILQFFISLD